MQCDTISLLVRVQDISYLTSSKLYIYPVNSCQHWFKVLFICIVYFEDQWRHPLSLPLRPGYILPHSINSGATSEYGIVDFNHTCQVFYCLSMGGALYPPQESKLCPQKHSPISKWLAHHVQWYIDWEADLLLCCHFTSLHFQWLCFEPPPPPLLVEADSDEGIPIGFCQYRPPPSTYVVISVLEY